MIFSRHLVRETHFLRDLSFEKREAVTRYVNRRRNSKWYGNFINGGFGVRIAQMETVPIDCVISVLIKTSTCLMQLREDENIRPLQIFSYAFLTTHFLTKDERRNVERLLRRIHHRARETSCSCTCEFLGRPIPPTPLSSIFDLRLSILSSFLRTIPAINEPEGATSNEHRLRQTDGKKPLIDDFDVGYEWGVGRNVIRPKSGASFAEPSHGSASMYGEVKAISGGKKYRTRSVLELINIFWDTLFHSDIRYICEGLPMSSCSIVTFCFIEFRAHWGGIWLHTLESHPFVSQMYCKKYIDLNNDERSWFSTWLDGGESISKRFTEELRKEFYSYQKGRSMFSAIAELIYCRTWLCCSVRSYT